MKFRNLPLVAALTFNLGYFLYYGIILCSGPLFTTNVCFFQFLCSDSQPKDWNSEISFLSDWRIGGHQITPNKLLFFLSLLPYAWYAIMFVLDAVWCRYVLYVKENIHPLRNIVHWLLVAPAMLMYSLAQLHGYNVLAVRHKTH